MNLKRIAWLVFTLAALPAFASTPTLQAFAYRQAINADSGHSLFELPLPDAVYAHALHADLSDLRVFNSAGGVVSHTICPAPAPTSAEPRLHTLQPFALQAGNTLVSGEDGRIELKTADGTQLTVTPGDAVTTPATTVSAYVLDLRELESPLHAIRLNWESANQASEATLRLQSSEDLESWMTLMPSATLLKTQAGELTLQRSRIPLPERGYRFLRIEAGARGPLPLIESVVVEMAGTPDLAPAHWVDATRQPPESPDTATAFWFDAGRRAPMHTAEIRLPAANMALEVLLQSRADAQQGWRTRWQGEVFALSSDNTQRAQTVIRFDATTDPLWRLQVVRGAESLGEMSPSLVLGYRPAHLRFLAQGEPPFTLAYGSARVERQPPDCRSLLGELPATEREAITGRAHAEQAPTTGNLNVLKPLPKPTPLRQIVLWAVLLAGALLVALMALSLLRKLRQE